MHYKDCMQEINLIIFLHTALHLPLEMLIKLRLLLIKLFGVGCNENSQTAVLGGISQDVDTVLLLHHI